MLINLQYSTRHRLSLSKSNNYARLKIYTMSSAHILLTFLLLHQPGNHRELRV